MKFLLSSTVEPDRLHVKPYKPFYSSGEPITITCDKPFEELYIISNKTGVPLVVPGFKNPFYGYPSTSTMVFSFTFPQIYGDEIYYFTTSQYQYSSDSFNGLKISNPQSYFKQGDTITISECTFKELYIVDVTTNYPILINGSYNIHKDATGNDINSETSSYVFTFPNFPSGKYYITSEYYYYSSRVFTYSNPGTLIISPVKTIYQPGETITISGSPFVELYIVDVIKSNPVKNIPNPFYSGSEINEYEFVLPQLQNGDYFITTSYYAYSSKSFQLSTVPTDISTQWSIVYQDNAALMKAGLYNTTVGEYDYIYNLIEPTDLSGNTTNTNNTALPPSATESRISSLDDRIVLEVNETRVSYNTSTGDLGINNGIYYLQVNNGYMRINNSYISFSSDKQIETEVIKQYTMSKANNTLTVVNIDDNADATVHNCKYIVKYNVVAIVPSADPYYYYVDIITSNDYTYEGTFPSGFPDPGWKYHTDANNIMTNINEEAYTLFYGASTAVQCFRLTYETATKVGIGDGSDYPPDILNDTFVLRIQPVPNNPSTTTIKSTENINLQWGGDKSANYDVYSTQYSYTNECTMVVTIPENLSADFSTPIYDVNGDEMNNIVTSKNAKFVQLFIPPTIPLNLITYDDLDDLEGKQYYAPTMIPGGDYLNVYADKLYVKFDSAGSPTMSADRCRQPWRLSHFVRSNYDPMDKEILKIAYNTAAALVYHASNNTSPFDGVPGSLTLNVNIWDLRPIVNPTYSADMVPGLLALIDALVLYNYDLEDPIINYSKNIKKLNGTDTRIDLITKLNAGNMNVYPILDSITSGGQQLGLAGCGFICTFDFLCRENFNVMLKYDKIKEWGVYDTIKIVDPSNKVFKTEEQFQDLIHIYKMLAMRGADFKNWDNWAKELITYVPDGNIDPLSYSQSILERAYLTNLRIRDINVTIEEELFFGDNFQGTQTTYKNVVTNGNTESVPDYYTDCYLYFYDESKKSNAPNVQQKTSYIDTIYNSPLTSEPVYVYTDFPITGIPDRGWGSLTVEIFSYMGIAFVGMNDYVNFCKWHRAYFHLTFIQNGGDMYGWDEDSTTDKINVNINPSPIPNGYDGVPNDQFWIPSYLSTESGNHDADWVNEVLNINKELHSYDIFKYPPERYYGGGSSVDNKTKMWANRFRPYRGNKNETQIRWTTPSYCLGYSPAWVAGGKTKKTDDWDYNEINRPVAEALNPCFTNTSGLYSATDGDNNILQAYILASLQWDINPGVDTGNGLTNFVQPVPPGQGATGPYGYDCDVSDFFYNTDIPGGEVSQDNSFKKGVKYAASTPSFKAKRWDYNPNHLPKTTTTTPNSNITDKIGYGITYNYDTQEWSQPKINGERCTTWKYIAKSIQRSMISKHGNGWGASFGNFASLSGFPSLDLNGARFETLGHDSSASAGTTKLDYIDFRLYQICETITKNNKA
jgi:hypothetical protein